MKWEEEFAAKTIGFIKRMVPSRDTGKLVLSDLAPRWPVQGQTVYRKKNRLIMVTEAVGVMGSTDRLGPG